MLSAFTDVAKRFKESCRTDDWADRMSHIYTACLLVVSAVLVSTATYAGEKIHCWIPSPPGVPWQDEYIKDYCWISNTYRIPMLETIPTQIDDRQEAEITYYQWVPLILIIQAFLFHFPNFIWNILNVHSGLNLGKLRTLADETQSHSRQERKEAIENIAKVLQRWIQVLKPYKDGRMTRAKTKMAKVFCMYCNKREGTYLTGLFLFCKLLYVVNVVGQFFLLNEFMGSQFSLYGYEFVHAMSTGAVMKESPRFPRVTLCDYEIRQLQNVQRHTVQCVLPINLFNEKVFLFLWFWFVMIAVISCISLIKWTYLFMFRRHAYSYVKKYLSLNKDGRTFTTTDKKLVRRFAENYLRNDGCYVAWMIGHNSTELVVMDLLEKMWSDYKESFEKQPNSNSHVTS